VARPARRLTGSPDHEVHVVHGTLPVREIDDRPEGLIDRRELLVADDPDDLERGRDERKRHALADGIAAEHGCREHLIHHHDRRRTGSIARLKRPAGEPRHAGRYDS
jgi:hypothetical protein